MTTISVTNDTKSFSFTVGSNTFEVTQATNTKIEVTLASTTSIGLQQETPSGNVDGSNKTFTLTNEPLGDWVIFTVNGQTQINYTVSGKDVTLSWAPPSGFDVYAFYLT